MERVVFQDEVGRNTTEDIRQATAAYRQTWVVSPLDRAIALVKDDIAKEEARRSGESNRMSWRK